MKLTDFIIQFLVDHKVNHVFGVTGGAALHLFDSADKHPDMRPIFHHHEQAASLAAQTYARARNGLGACIVTTGPGGTNAITGVTAAWLDSIPCIYISGQARYAHTTRDKMIRQLGTQQFDIISLTQHITNYSVMVDDPEKIKFYLQKAIYFARTGRPGPVWIDLPLEFQWTDINPEQCPDFDPVVHNQELPPTPNPESIKEVIRLLNQAQRPLILVGYGVRLAHAEQEITRLIESLSIPFLTSWNASDMFDTSHPLNLGRPGMFGQRGSNLAIANCDLLIAVGSHLCIPITGTMFDAFARDAKIVVVDADQKELDYQTVRVDVPIQADAKQFLKHMLQNRDALTGKPSSQWLQKCHLYKEKYNRPPHTEKSGDNLINSYTFIDHLSNELDPRDVIVLDGGGTIDQVTFQTLRLKKGQRLIISAGLCAMGTGLPESVGAHFADIRRVICLCGDGSMQFNIQEMQTIVHYNLPVKVFVLNNDGYLSIRQTQDGFFDSHFIGSEKKGGVSLPDLTKVAQAYGIPSTRVAKEAQLQNKIRWALEHPGPVLCEILSPRDQEVLPRQGFEKTPEGTFKARPLEDMYPFLDRREFIEAMITKPLQ